MKSDFKPRPYGGEGAPWEPECVGVQSLLFESAEQRSYDERMGILAKHFLTMVRPEDTGWIMEKIGPRIAGKRVVEIGAGIGLLANEMAKVARRVYAIEADPGWSLLFVKWLYVDKPLNLTWILDRAQNLVGELEADVAIVVTGSDEDNLRQLAGQFAPEVIMPWQDWRGGKARVPWFRGDGVR